MTYFNPPITPLWAPPPLQAAQTPSTLVDQFGASLNTTVSLDIPEWFNRDTYIPPEKRPITPMPKEAAEYAQFAGAPTQDEITSPTGFNSPSPLKLLNKPSTLMPAHVIKLWQHKPHIFYRDAMDVTLDLWQEEATQLYTSHARLALLASKGPGKEQPVSSKLYTPKGERRFGDLKVGDEVFSEYGLPTKIRGVYPQGVKDVYKVTFDDGSSTECGLEHLWKVNGFVKGRKRSTAVLTLKQIMERGLFIMQGKQTHHHFQIVFFHSLNLPLQIIR